MNIHKAKIVAPCIHLNGTSSDSLTDLLSDAYDALSQAMNALKQCAPNGRDYYTGNASLDRADIQHRERMEAVSAVMNSIETEMGLIIDGKQVEE